MRPKPILEVNRTRQDVPLQSMSQIPVITAHELNSTTTSSQLDAEMKEGSSDSSSTSSSVPSDQSDFCVEDDEFYNEQCGHKRKCMSRGRGRDRRRRRSRRRRRDGDGEAHEDLVEARRVSSNQHMTQRLGNLEGRVAIQIRCHLHELLL